MSGSAAKFLPLAAVYTVLMLAGCGAAASTQSSNTDRSPAKAGSDGSPAQQESRPEVYRGGEQSIEDFGAEAAGAEREAVVSTFTNYLNAIADEDYPVACESLALGVRQQLLRLVPPQLRHKGCAAALPGLLAPTAASIAARQAKGTVFKVRVGGERGFIVFHAAGAKLYEMPMVRERGRWELGLVAASVLVPSAATLGR
jgi:hypothetical protein